MMKKNTNSKFLSFIDGNFKGVLKYGLLLILLTFCVSGFAQGQFGGKVAVLQGTTGTTTWYNTTSQSCDGAGTGNLSTGNTSSYTAYLGDKLYMGANTLTYGFPSSGDGSFLQWRYYVVGGTAPAFGTALTLPFSSSGVCSSGSNKKYEYVPNTGANSVHCTAAGSYRLDVNLVAYQNGNNYTVYTSGNYIPVTVNALGNPTLCTASISGTTASLGWTKFAGGSTAYNVMIVRYPKDATPTAPTNGTAYALNSAIGSGTVVYATGAGSSTTNTVTASTNYDYYFYSENWSYYSSGQKVTALAPAPTITLGASPSLCKGITTANLSYTATTNSPNQYSIVYDSTAISAGFSSVTNATLATSPIVLSVPSGATPGTYNGVLTVRNSTSGAVSSSNSLTVTIIPLPNTGTLSGLQSFCMNGTSALTTNGTTGGTWSSSNSAIATVNSSGGVTGAGVGVATITYSLNGSGCSNSSTLGVTINGNTSSTETITACDTYTWSVNGQTYTSSGTYTYVSGCDTKILNLTITPSTSSSTTASACGSYTWSVNGQTYSSSGTYTSVTGCDTKTLNLTITPITNSTTTTSACDTYTWSVNGQTYTSSGTYTFVSGCDTKTLVLTIYNSTPSSQTTTACDSYFWSVDGNTYTTSGTYVFEGTNAAGCSQNQTLYLTINASSSSSQTEVACDTYTWAVNAQTYTTSGTYTYTSTSASGCQNVKILNLTINQSTSSSQTESACDSYTWAVDGQTYTSSGTYTYSSTNASGCPDIKTLSLTITPSSTHTTAIAACDTYTWIAGNGQTYTASGTYTYVSGCDTKTLELTITPSSTNTTNATACDSYTWSLNGQTYTTSGTRSLVTGCHTEVLNLTINNSTSSSQTVTACDSYIWSLNGQTYTSSGTYTFVGTNASGCTDTKTLNLTINNSTSSSQTVSACGSYTWSANGTTYTTSGTYTKVGTNASSCTDTKTLILTISPLNRSNAGSSWANGQNDGTIGFGAWSLSTVGGSAGFFTGSSDINNGGSSSWGMYAGGGTNVASAVRPVSMNVGNTLSFSMDNGFIDNGKVIGFGLQNNSGQNLMELLFIGGQTNYSINDSVLGFSSSIGYTSGGMNVSLTYTGTNTYSITITTKAGATATFTGRTFSTQAGGQRPTQIRFFNAGAGSGSNYDMFFNSLAISNPVITAQPSTTAQNICAGTTPTNLTVSASGTGLTYQWYSNSTSSYSGSTTVSGATANTYTPQNTTAGTSYYYCVVTDPCGTTYSNVSGAVIVTAPLNAGVLSGTQEVCVGGLTTFSTNGTSGGSWASANTSIASVNLSGVVTGVGAGTTSITYSLNGTGGCSSISVSRDITAFALPSSSITNNTGVTKITCSVSSINVTATGGSSYSWSNGVTVVGTTDSLDITSAGTYTVTVTNANGCSSTASIVITQDTAATSSTETITACDNYTWSVNGQIYTESGTYTSAGTNASGCVDTKTLVLTITPKPDQPTLACYQSATFNDNTCSWDVTGTQPVAPLIACYQTATWNDTTCQYDVTGTQPTIPTLACYESAKFNTNTCSWDVTGTKAAQPTLACYESATFNTETCSWDVTGTQPAQPILACYETATFNTTTCAWNVTGTQPANPVVSTTTSTTLCGTSTVVLTSSVAASSTVSLQWMKNGIAIANANATTLTVTNTAALGTGAYTVVRTIGNCTNTSNAINVTANPAPVVTANGPITFCATTTVVLTSSIAPSATQTLQWFKGTTAILAQTGATLTVTNATGLGTGSYSVKVTVGTCVATSNSITVTVNAVSATPIVSTSTPGVSMALCGSSATLNIKSSVAPSTTAVLAWYKDGSLLSSTINVGTTNQTITVSQAGTYTVQVTNSSTECSSALSNGLTVTQLVQAPTPVVSSSGGTSFCSNQTLVLTSSVPAEAGTTTLQWRKGTANISGATGTSLTITNATTLAAGSYTVVATQVGGCSSPVSNAIAVTMNAAPAVAIVTTSPATASRVLCGNSVTLSSSVIPSTTVSIQWMKDGVAINGATSQTYPTSEAGSYTVVVSNIPLNGCSTTSSPLVLTQGIVAPTPVVAVTSGITSLCGTASVVLSSNVLASSTVTLRWFKGNTAITNATSTTYTITGGTTAAGSYTVVATQVGGCPSAASNATAVTWAALPATATVSTATAGALPILCGTSGTLNIKSSVAPTATAVLTWYRDSSPITSTVNVGTTNQTITVNQVGTYTVVVTNPSTGCSATSTQFNVTQGIVAPTPVVTVTSGVTSLCGTASVVLTSSVPASSAVTLKWFKGTTVISTATSTTHTITGGTTAAGSYTVVATQVGGCPSAVSNATAVTWAALPATASVSTATVGASSILCGTPGTLNIKSSVAPSTTATLQWFLNGSLLSPTVNVGANNQTITVSQSGTYTVVVTNPSTGCSSLISTGFNVAQGTVATAPVVTPDTSVLCGASTVSTILLSSIAPATGTTLQWQRNGANITTTGGTAQNLTVTNTAANSGTYRVILSQTGFCPANSNTVTVTTGTAPTTVPTVTTVTSTGTASTITVLSSTTPTIFLKSSVVQVTGTTTVAPILLKWYKDGVEMTSTTNQGTTNQTIAITQAGSYTVRAFYGTSQCPGTSSAARVITGTSPVISRTVSVPFDVIAYPNPYTETINLSLTTSTEDKVSIMVYDMTGRLIERREVRPSDMVEQQIGDRYPSGVYNVVLNQGEEVKTLRVVKR
ncbi:MAG: T9SS type A sorting domain-containing protein [Flavobacterium sp.]|nr:T9SS type A sorting domain-containing protein [Flavobacterium sp.]